MQVYASYLLDSVIKDKSSAAIVGAGFAGKQLYDELNGDSRKKVIAFLDNNSALAGENINGVPIKKPSEVSADIYIIAIFDDDAREALRNQLLTDKISTERIYFYASVKDYEYYSKLPSIYYKNEIDLKYEKQFNRKMDWEKPKTYNEIINWEKLNVKDERRIRLADKYLVRNWIKEKIGEKYLTKLLGVWDNADDIDFDSLPRKFVLKANNGSGRNIVVVDKAKLNLDETRRKLNKWINQNFAYNGYYEMHYCNIKPKIICEEYLEEISKGANDFDIFCFHGEPHFIQRVRGAHTPEWSGAFYDLDWNRQPFYYACANDPEITPKPEFLDEMLRLTRILCKDFTHVRIDWYGISSKRFLFSEMTFSSWAGLSLFHPEKYDRIFGDLINNNISGK